MDALGLDQVDRKVAGVEEKVVGETGLLQLGEAATKVRAHQEFILGLVLHNVAHDSSGSWREMGAS